MSAISGSIAFTATVTRTETATLQINVGKRCNQACHHCHVDAGPKRAEQMTGETTARVMRVLEASPTVMTVDITGGAPELNANFRDLVRESRRMGREVIDRCNLTILFEPGQEDLGEFLAEQRVMVTASLPCYTAANVDKQRGNGVFDKSIRALQRLNELGYGRAGSGLVLTLVFNPGGASLPPPEKALEEDYRRELREHFGIEFNRLATITNMPIARFASDLMRQGLLQQYMGLLVNHFNPATVEQLMCRSLVSIGWDGQLYDCDFNQMLGIGLPGARTVWDVESFSGWTGRVVRTASHCYGCTAGAGSSCGGSLSSD